MNSFTEKEQAHITSKVVHCCSLAFYLYDLSSSKLKWTNEGYFGILGYQDYDFDLDSMDFPIQFYHPEDVSVFYEKFEIFQKGGDTWSGVYRLKHKKGHWVWVYSKVSIFEKDNNGNPKILVGVIMDTSQKLNTEKQLNILFKEGKRSRSQSLIDKLTKRERGILVLIANGNSYTKIAKILHIQPDTVNRHRKNILRKLNLKNISQLSCFATETGII